MSFENILQQLEFMGLADFVLPTLLIFTIVYSVFNKIKLFNKSGNTVISLVLAALTVVPHVLGRYPACYDPVIIINNSIPKIAILMVGVISFFLILGIFGFRMNFLTRFAAWIGILAIIFIAFTFLTSDGCHDINWDIPYAAWIAFLLGIGAFVLIIWFITGGSSSGGPPDDDIY